MIQSAVVSFFFILYFIRIPQCCTDLYMIFIFLWHVFFVSIFVYVIGHVFCGSPDQIAALFFHQVVHIKTAVSLAFESPFPLTNKQNSWLNSSILLLPECCLFNANFGYDAKVAY